MTENLQPVNLEEYSKKHGLDASKSKGTIKQDILGRGGVPGPEFVDQYICETAEPPPEQVRKINDAQEVQSPLLGEPTEEPAE